MMKSDEQYQVPVWMRPLLPLLCNTGGNDPEELLNDTETTASANIVRYVLIVAVRSQIDLLQLLYRKGLLRTEIPGGFSPEEAQELLDNLVRSHISKALSGERMAARDRNADLAWIRQQLVDAAWFVRATLEAHGMGVGNESPSALTGIRKSPAAPLLPGHAGHGLVGFQLCGLSVVCGLCRASIVAGLLRAGCKVR
ncbi:hypothetical protein [Escherichia coli]|uniref:hypothetical protein n=2 Tax=Escherichia coli TaxID=562 RepID=UPI0027B9A413|nr:hypothetical protein [Escherichia coli]